ncbi:uncharacterized protein BDV17DRAFT_284673 [Aspergillus undulatus]|uniref:uncharacterized protein n=1 Tax=Aspergillus undulatus TaxID=1810928 RepID=UPI003CCDA099
MHQETHIIDPDGEVIIVLHNTYTPIPEATKKADTDPPPELLGDATPRNSVSPVHEADLAPLYSRKGKKKKKKKKRHTISRAYGDLPRPDSRACERPTEDPIPGPSEEHVPEFVEAAVSEPIEEPTEEASGRIFRIQISAKHLTLASPVFKQILTGGWKESVTLLQKGSVEISAEGWDINAFLVLLRVIHCQNSQLPQTLSLEMLANVAIIADYYECKGAIGVLKEIWIKGLPEPDTTTSSRDLMLFLWVAFFYELPVQFKQTTSTAMLSSKGYIDSLGLPIPATNDITEDMNIHRQQAIEKVVLLLHETQDAFLNSDRGCGFECSSIMYGALTKELHRANMILRPVAPFPGLAYDQLMQKVSSIRSPMWITKERDPWGSNFQREQHCDSSSFAQLFGHLNSTVAGLDLQTCSLEY